MTKPTLLPYSVAICENTLAERYGLVPPSQSDLKALIEDCASDFVTEVNEYYRPNDEVMTDPTNGNLVTRSTLDTAEREWLADIVVKHLLGRDFHWPLNGDPKEYTRLFVASLSTAATERGWTWRFLK